MLHLAFIIVLSRGLFEVYFSKIFGYVMGISSIVIIVLYFLYKRLLLGSFLYSSRIQDYFFWISYSLYVISVVSSLVITAIYNDHVFTIGVLYSVIHLGWIAAVWFLKANGLIEIPVYIRLVAILTLWLAISGALELLGFLPTPITRKFENLLRLVGTTGAMQHFSFSISVLTMLSYWIYTNYRSANLLIISIFSGIITFVALTRNGMFVIVATLTLLYIQDWRLLLRGLLGAILLVASIGFVMWQEFPQLADTLSARVGTMLSPSAPGNPVRIQRWLEGMEAWMEGPVVIGDSVGRYSQAGTRLGITETQHFESAIMQQLSNYGVIGLMGFLGALLSIVLSTPDRFLRSLGLTMIVVFFFYPGSESLPFIAMWFLWAITEGSRNGSHPRACKERKLPQQ